MNAYLNELHLLFKSRMCWTVFLSQQTEVWRVKYLTTGEWAFWCSEMIASLVKTQFHPILKQAICNQEVFYLNKLISSTKKQKERRKNTSQPTTKSINTWFYKVKILKLYFDKIFWYHRNETFTICTL